MIKKQATGEGENASTPRETWAAEDIISMDGIQMQPSHQHHQSEKRRHLRLSQVQVN